MIHVDHFHKTLCQLIVLWISNTPCLHLYIILCALPTNILNGERTFVIEKSQMIILSTQIYYWVMQMIFCKFCSTDTI